MLEQDSLVTLAVDEIHRLILAGAFAPGEQLREVPLSEQLGISRPPLREALRVLAGRRILVQVPRRGFRVIELSQEDIDEIYSLRYVLDRFALETAVPNLRVEALKPLEDVMKRMSAACDAEDSGAVVLTNREFHVELVALAGHGRLSATYEALMDQMQLCMSYNLRSEAGQAGSLKEGLLRHQGLLDSLYSHELSKVIAALDAHGERSYLPDDVNLLDAPQPW
ncbi:MAG: transcriptional regulator, GntR family [Pseudonocardiales bacterium]|nr:transcriptional regulator, GntR family [Pseudonocardiales bacterium]